MRTPFARNQGRTLAAPTPSIRPPVNKRPQEWNNWTEVTVKVMQLPKIVTTRQIWRLFSRFGDIARIDIGDSKSSTQPPVLITFWYVSRRFLASPFLTIS